MALLKRRWSPAYLVLLCLLPIFIDRTGLYLGHRDYRLFEVGGLILPLGFFAGAFLIAYLFLRWIIKREKPDLPLAVLWFFGGLSLVSLFLAAAGAVASKNPLPLVLLVQYLTGGAGLGLAVYLFGHKRLDYIQACGLLGLAFLLYIIIHFGFSLVHVGVQKTLSRHISHLTPLGGIHQILIYYPYTVSAVFLFAIPRWRNSLLIVPMFGVVAFYIYLFQVRGAILSFVLALSAYLVFFTERRRITRWLTLLLWLVAAYLFFEHRSYMGRFSDVDFGLRDQFWTMTYENIRRRATYLVYGTLFNGLTIDPGYRIDFGQSGPGSYHNQYLEFVKSGGLVLLGTYLTGLALFLRKIWTRARALYARTGDRIAFWGLAMILIQSGVDMMVNTPIRVTNPAVLTWFFWAGYYYYLKTKAEDVNQGV